MAAYVISDLQVVDAALIVEYRTLAAESVARYGGRYLARYGTIQPLAGDWTPDAIVIIEFESIERARQWWDSPEYAPARAIAERALSRRVIVVEGL